MSIKYNRIDMALISTKPAEVVDIAEQGGIESCHLVVELAGGGEVQVNGSTTADGEFTKAFSVTVPSDGVYRGRLPIDAPRFICLSAENGATLSVRA